MKWLTLPHYDIFLITLSPPPLKCVCLDRSPHVNELLIRNESEYVGGSLTDKVEELLKDAATHAEQVFDGIIKCKVRADQTRTALTVLQRYRFLFNLPRSIEKNINNVG